MLFWKSPYRLEDLTDFIWTKQDVLVLATQHLQTRHPGKKITLRSEALNRSRVNSRLSTVEYKSLAEDVYLDSVYYSDI